MASVDEATPLSMLQVAHWVEYQRNPSSPTGNRGSAIRIRAPLEMALVERAYQIVTDRHAALRTTFGMTHGSPFQRVHSTFKAVFRHVDATGWSDARLAREVQQELERPYVLEREPAGRLTVLTIDAEHHVFMFCAHHIHADILMPDVVHDEVARIYRAYVTGTEPDLAPPPARTYAEFVARERATLTSPHRAELLAYWEKTLRDAPKILALPVDRPRPRGGVVVQHTFATVMCEHDELVRLRRFCKAEGTSTFRMLLTAYFVLLHRYTGQADLLVGIPVDCRGPEFAGVTGNFANLVVVRARPEGDLSFRKLLAEVTEAVAGAMEHKDLPFLVAIEELLPAGERGRTPFFQTLFHLNKFRVRPELSPTFIPEVPIPWHAELEGWPIDGSVPHSLPSGPMEIELLLCEIDGRLAGELRYDAGIFERDTIERMAKNFACLLRSITVDPDVPLSVLPLVSEEERRLLVVDWNRTSAPFSDTCVHVLIEATVAKWPDVVAVRHRDTELTYVELNAHANRLANRMRASGVTAEALVALLLPRGVDIVVAILATWKAGGAYVPVDPTYPEERVAMMLEDAAPVIVVTTRALAARLSPNMSVLVLDDDDDDLAASGTHNLDATTSSRSLAYVIFTSGSTGRPKGVLIEHRGVCNYGEDVVRRWKIEPGSRVLNFASFSFDSSVADYVGSLISGATLHIRPDDVLGGVDLAQLLRDQAITHVDLPPAVWATLPDIELPRLETAVTSGDACPVDIVTRWGRSRRMLNEYGPTEITVCATSYDCVSGMRPLIGRPIANVSAYVLDERRQPVPIGVAGELYLTGPGLARGYLNHPELTAKKFMRDPFTPDDQSARLYRTGDLVRWSPDGSLDFLERVDDQVKIRGFRIELGEVAVALAAHPEVQTAACVVRNRDHHKQLVAFVVLTEGSAPGVTDRLRAFLRLQLPPYMVPASIYVTAAMPLSAHGKIDRVRLTAMSDANDDSAVVGDLPKTADAPVGVMESSLLALWRDVLRMPLLSRNDDFFESGGDSLLALEVAHAMGGILGRELPAAVLFEHRTVGAILGALATTPQARDFVPLRSEGDQPPLFFFHAAGGEVFAYRELVDRLEPSRPIRGVVSRAVTSGEAEHDSLALMCDAYADAIVVAEPTGSLSLVGWSMGGVIALEVAKRLEDRGRRVGFLALIDSHIVTSGAEGLHPFASVASELGPLASRLATLGDAELLIVTNELKAAAPADRPGVALALARERNLVDDGVKALPRDDSANGVNARHHSFMNGYRPAHVLADIHYFLAAASAAHASRTAPWSTSTRGRYFEHVVPGNHYTVLRAPHVTVLAAALDAALRASA